jgi:hypothetical protein
VGPSDRGGVQVGSGVLGNGVLEAASLQLMAPLLDMTQSLRRVVRQIVEFREEFNKAQNTQLDLLANLCSSMREISYQLHLRNVLFKQVQVGTGLEVFEGIQQVVKLGEDRGEAETVEVGVAVVPVEVVENAEVADDVGAEKVGNEDKMMRES